MSETEGFISNNLSSSNSDFFSPTTKFKEKEDSSKVIKDNLKLNDNEENNKKISPTKVKFKNKNRSLPKNIKNYKIEHSNEKKIINNRINNYKEIENNKNDNSLVKDINNILINKFIDLSEKCGVGYILTNGDVGTCFNDGTKLIRIKCTFNYVYYNEQGKYQLINAKKKISNSDYEKKINALVLFNKAFIKNSKKRNTFAIDPKIHKKNCDVFVKKWIKSQHAYFFLLSNEKVQVIFDDKTQIIFDFQNKNITFINKSKQKIIQNISQNKFTDEEMNKRVKYAKKILGKI